MSKADLRVVCFSPSHTLSWVVIFRVLFAANCNRKRRGLTDQGATLLWSIHVWGHPDTDPDLSGWSHLAWASAQQWGHACGWVCGVSQAVERYAVCVLHSRGDTRVHSGVSVRSVTLWRGSSRGGRTGGGGGGWWKSMRAVSTDVTIIKSFVAFSKCTGSVPMRRGFLPWVPKEDSE